MSRKRFRQAIAWLITGSIVAIVVIGLLFAIVRSLLVGQLNETSDHSIAGVTRIETELQRLIIDAQRFAVSDPAMPPDALRMRADILFSRVALAETGDMRGLLDPLPQYRETMARLRDYLSATDALLSHAAPPASAGTEIARLGLDLQPLLSDITFAATQRAGELRTEARQQ